MPSEQRRERVLVPVAVLEGATVDEDLAAVLSSVDVVVLGYHEIPEQTAPSQMRQQFEKQTEAALDAIVKEFDDAGGAAERRLVFTPTADRTIERVADEVGATAIALSNPVAPVESILVPLRGEVDARRIACFVSRLRADRDIDITLLAATDEASVPAAEGLVTLAAETFAAEGVPARAIRRVTETTATPVEVIVDAAIEHDLTVMGEREPDWRTFLFGDLSERVAAESLGPVLVVRRGIVRETDG